LELTEQNNELKRKWECVSESNRQRPCAADQPAFTSSPAYKSLMASLGLGSTHSRQVR